MSHMVCPWWLGYFLINPLRRIMQNPETILSRYIKAGMCVMDIGCGMGYFTLPMAQLIGDKGNVLAIDLQEKMIESLKQRASKAGLSTRIAARVCSRESLQIDDYTDKVDFALAFAVVHEVPDPARLLSEINRSLKPKSLLLISEPSFHVSKKDFDNTISLAQSIGFDILEYPQIKGSVSALLAKNN